jgi:hypothetical protein
MDTFGLLTLVAGVMLSVISFFLKRTMDELKEVKQMSYNNKSEIDILKTDYKNKIENLSEKFEELKLTMSDLIKEIRELNKRIK